MSRAEEQLIAIGFGSVRREPCPWRGERLNRGSTGLPTANGPEPACSAALLRWRDLLARNAGQSPYRISRA